MSNTLGYTINENIQIGDIILLSTNTKYGKIIQKATKGPYSHVALVFNYHKVIEALTSSVQCTSTGEFVIKDKNNIKILRPKILEDKEIALPYQESICTISNPLRYTKYNYVDAMNAIREGTKKKSNDKYFCSQLVSMIYRRAGIILFGEKEDHKVVPNDYLSLIDINLIDVTDETISDIPRWFTLEQENIEYLDLDKKTEYFEAKLLSDYVEKMKIKFDEMGIVLVKDIGIFEILFIIDDLDNLNIKKELDLYSKELYMQLNINEHVHTFFNNLVMFDYEKFENDLDTLDIRDIESYRKNLNYQEERIQFRITEYKAYLLLFNKVEEEAISKYRYRINLIDILREYYNLYLSNALIVEKDFLYKRPILNKKYQEKMAIAYEKHKMITEKWGFRMVDSTIYG